MSSMNMRFDFGEAVRRLKLGRLVCREGWNGKGMWLCQFPVEEWRDAVSRSKLDVMMLGVLEVAPFIVMKTADRKLVPWLASQTDVQAEDWMSVPAGTEAPQSASSPASTERWVYEIPALPVTFDEAPSILSRKMPFRIIAFPDLRHACDFVDKLERWVRPVCSPVPRAFLTLAAHEEFLFEFAKWARRWGQLKELKIRYCSQDASAEVIWGPVVRNPFDVEVVNVQLEPWLP